MTNSFLKTSVARVANIGAGRDASYDFAAPGNFLASSDSLDQIVNSLVTLSQTNVITSIANNGDGTFTLNFQGTPQAIYYLQAADDPGPSASWTTLLGSTNTAPIGGAWSFVVSNSAPAFYRSVAANPAP